MQPHQIIRMRHETRRRRLTVASIDRLTPNMLRIGFTSPELHDFVSASADDHIKLFFSGETARGEDGKPSMRDFTPRLFDIEKGSLTIDFAIHDAGPATEWASAAKVGDTLEIGGPRGSAIVPDDFDWYLLVGDETALPAIGRRVEELRPDVPVTTVAIVESVAEAQHFDTRAAWTPVWVTRDGSRDDAARLLAALEALALPAGEGFVWIAAEAAVARAVRTYVQNDRNHPPAWIKAAGYWTRGLADTHSKIDG